MSARPSWDGSEVETWLASAPRVISGPLNDGYRVTVDGVRYFVRVRTYDDDLDYAQHFAAERIVYPLLPSAVKRPRLVGTGTLPTRGLPYAVFDWIDDYPIDWKEPRNIAQVVELLRHVHMVSGNGFGSIAAPEYPGDAPEAFFATLFALELSRLATHAEAKPYQCLQALAVLFRSESPKLCHGDIHARNFMARRGRPIQLIDWEASRWRVPAADFNQVHLGWLSEQRQHHLITSYAKAVGRAEELFIYQVRCLQAFWHIRTWNFTVISGRRVFNLSPNDHAALAQEYLALAK